MGIFDFFKKKEVESLDIHSKDEIRFTDLNVEMFFQDPKILNQESYDGGLEKVVHLIILNQPLYGLFNKAEVTFGMENGKPIFLEDGTKRIAQVKFIECNRNIEKIKEITKELMSIFSINDDPWSEVDEMRIKEGVWRGRSTDKLKFTISFNKNDGLTLDFLGFNDFLNKISTK